MPRKNKLSLTVQFPDPRLKAEITRDLLLRWVHAALLGPAQFTIRFVDAVEGRRLNHEFRGKDYATNVLTFSYAEPGQSAEAPAQADIVLCTDVLQNEATQQHKPLLAHAAHLVVHGVLHAQGYDHETDDEADEMEGLETEIMTELGLPDPYLERQDAGHPVIEG